jgi:hypothetical protein
MSPGRVTLTAALTAYCTLWFILAVAGFRINGQTAPAYVTAVLGFETAVGWWMLAAVLR